MSAAATSAAGTSSGTTSATSWVASGYAGSAGPRTGSAAAAAAASTAKSSSNALVRGGRPYAAITRGCSSPAWPASHSCSWPPRRTGAPHVQRGAPAGVPGRLGRRPHLEGQVVHRADRAGRLDRVGPGLGAPRAPPAGQLAVAGEDAGHPRRLVGQRGGERRELRLGGAPVGGEDRRDAGRAGARQEHQAGLEQGGVGEAAADVPHEGAEQPGQQGRAQLRLVLAQRVRDLDRGAARVFRREHEAVRLRRRRERVTVHLDEAGGAERAGDRPQRPLPLGEAVARGGARLPDGDVAVTLEADDLLGQVGGVGEVGGAARTAG